MPRIPWVPRIRGWEALSPMGGPLPQHFYSSHITQVPHPPLSSIPAALGCHPWAQDALWAPTRDGQDPRGPTHARLGAVTPMGGTVVHLFFVLPHNIGASTSPFKTSCRLGLFALGLRFSLGQNQGFPQSRGCSECAVGRHFHLLWGPRLLRFLILPQHSGALTSNFKASSLGCPLWAQDAL